MDFIYFFPSDVIANNPDLFKPCDCEDQTCKLLFFNNGFTKNDKFPENVIQVDFVEKTKL